MAYLERLLQINIAVMAVMGAMLLGMGERSIGPPLWVATAAPIAVWLTDLTGRVRLSRRVANILMLVAAAVSSRHLFPLRSELQALGVAWFLIYLQIILLFQQKDARTYWLLVTLSLLQVVVATLFSQGASFGLLLLVYMLFGFSAMTLLSLYYQWSRYGRTGAADGRSAVAASAPLDRRPAARWPLAGQSTRLVGLPGGSCLAALGGDLLRRFGRMSLHTVAVTLVLFFAVPRFGELAWRGPIAPPEHTVGFNDKVTLGDLGQIIESHDDVMFVGFYKALTDTPQPVQGEIYLQGALLMTYENGQWAAGKPAHVEASSFMVPAPELARDRAGAAGDPHRGT